MLDLLLKIPPFLYLIFAFVALILVIGWILVPFILMNTNAYLRRILREQERTNALLEATRPSRSPDTTAIPSVRVEPRDR